MDEWVDKATQLGRGVDKATQPEEGGRQGHSVGGRGWTRPLSWRKGVDKATQLEEGGRQSHSAGGRG